jgi:hypothetical protein
MEPQADIHGYHRSNYFANMNRNVSRLAPRVFGLLPKTPDEVTQVKNRNKRKQSDIRQNCNDSGGKTPSHHVQVFIGSRLAFQVDNVIGK